MASSRGRALGWPRRKVRDLVCQPAVRFMEHPRQTLVASLFESSLGSAFGSDRPEPFFFGSISAAPTGSGHRDFAGASLRADLGHGHLVVDLLQQAQGEQAPDIGLAEVSGICRAASHPE